jgi:hypothetical protein
MFAYLFCRRRRARRATKAWHSASRSHNCTKKATSAISQRERAEREYIHTQCLTAKSQIHDNGDKYKQRERVNAALRRTIDDFDRFSQPSTRNLTCFNPQNVSVLENEFSIDFSLLDNL